MLTVLKLPEDPDKLRLRVTSFEASLLGELPEFSHRVRGWVILPGSLNETATVELLVFDQGTLSLRVSSNRPNRNNGWGNKGNGLEAG